jgi:4-hydroxybenzoate polyprenyltransferase
MTYTDISRIGFIAKLPPKMQSFALLMRLDRPVGIWLLLTPCWWAVILADWRRFDLLLLFALGAVVMRAAGCIINDLWDRDIDGAVARTSMRPLVTGEITKRQAFAALFILLVIGLFILLSLPPLAIVLGVLSLGLVITYPLMKRFTWWPQLFLGFTFNFGVLIGWAAATGALSMTALYLYAAGIFWTLGYDTIYAHQDKTDDALIGVKSTARLFAEKSKYWVSGFYAAVIVFLFMAAPSPYVLLPAAHFIWQILRWDMNNEASCLRIFKSNRDAGLLILFSLMLSVL